MSVVIRFNTVIVRKSGIDGKYPGGLTQYRQDVSPNVPAYYEDGDLTAVNFMGADDYIEQLRDKGLTHGRGGELIDVAGASQDSGVDPRCGWLEVGHCNGLPVCWLRGTPPGYVVDFTSRRFIRRAAEVACPSCGAPFGVGAAVRAINYRERVRGPLAFVDVGREQERPIYVLKCLACEREAEFDESGRMRGIFRLLSEEAWTIARSLPEEEGKAYWKGYNDYVLVGVIEPAYDPPAGYEKAYKEGWEMRRLEENELRIQAWTGSL